MVETQTPWEGITSYSIDLVHPEYVPALAKLSDRYRMPLRVIEGQLPDYYDRGRKVFIHIGDSPRVLDLTPEEHNNFLNEYLFLSNYPG